MGGGGRWRVGGLGKTSIPAVATYPKEAAARCYSEGYHLPFHERPSVRFPFSYVLPSELDGRARLIELMRGGGTLEKREPEILFLIILILILNYSYSYS